MCGLKFPKVTKRPPPVFIQNLEESDAAIQFQIIAEIKRLASTSQYASTFTVGQTYERRTLVGLKVRVVNVGVCDFL